MSYIVVHYRLHPSYRGELLGSFWIRCEWWRWSSWVHTRDLMEILRCFWWPSNNWSNILRHVIEWRKCKTHSQCLSRVSVPKVYCFPGLILLKLNNNILSLHSGKSWKDVSIDVVGPLGRFFQHLWDSHCSTLHLRSLSYEELGLSVEHVCSKVWKGWSYPWMWSLNHEFKLSRYSSDFAHSWNVIGDMPRAYTRKAGTWYSDLLAIIPHPLLQFLPKRSSSRTKWQVD